MTSEAAVAEIENELSTVDDSILGEEQWNIVIIKCSSLAAKWEQLSGYLGLSMGTIDRIKADHSSTNCAGCWNEALKEWIRQKYKTETFGKPTWRTLLKSVALVDRLLFKKLANEQQDTTKKTQEYQTAIKAVEASRLEIESQHASIVKIINQSFRELHEILNCRRKELLEIASNLVEEKIAKLSLQKEELDGSLNTLRQKIANEKSMIESTMNKMTVAVHDKSLNQMSKESSSHSNFNPVEEADIDVQMNYAEELRRLCQHMKVVTSPVDPSKCKIDSLDKVEVMHPFNLKLYTYSMSGKPQRKPVHVEARLTSCVDNSITQANIEKMHGTNVYSIECTPRVRGQHQLEVTVNGLAVERSPFPLVVKIPPIQLGEPLRVVDGLKGPTGIAFNSADELIVAEFNGGIVVLDKDRKIVRRINRHGHNYDLEEPWGVAVDREDNIYVTDQDNRRIYKFNKQLELVNHNMARQAKCFGITVVGERVLVVEKRCQRLEVFTKDLKFLKMIETGIEGCCLAFDGDSKLYICDALTHRVQILTDQGERLYSIGDKPGLGLQGPHFVCFDRDYMYVTEYEGHCVSVFTTNGTFVTSFGSAGSGMGQFDHPYGIAFDKSGFLYVSDRLNNRLQVF